MYNYDVLRNNYRLSIDAKPGEIWFMKDAPKNIVDKSRPVLVISDQEATNGGLVTCLMMTTHHTYPNSIPVYCEGGISFVVPTNEYVFSYKDLHTYGTLMTTIPERILEFVKYNKFRIYGSPYSELHEKAIYDYQMNIIRRLLDSNLKLNRLHGSVLDPREYIGGKFFKVFKDWEEVKPKEFTKREGDMKESISVSFKEPEINEKEEEEQVLVYTDTDSQSSFNSMGAALMKALVPSSPEEKKKKVTNKKAPSVKKEVTVKETKSTRLKPYFELNDEGKVVIKKTKNMTHGEMGLLLADVKHTNSYTIFATRCSMTLTTIKKRCLDCIKILEEAGTPVSDDTKSYFTTDQRVKNNYQPHTIDNNMKKKGCGQFAASAAEMIAKKAEKEMPSYVC